MCSLYRMTATVDEMRRLFGPFQGDRDNLGSFDNIFPGYQAPVLRRAEGALKLEMMTWGFPGPAAAGGRPVTNVRNLSSPFWPSALEHNRQLQMKATWGIVNGFVSIGAFAFTSWAAQHWLHMDGWIPGIIAGFAAIGAWVLASMYFAGKREKDLAKLSRLPKW